MAEIDEILIDASPGEVRAALCADGRVVELAIERATRRSMVGDIHLARVERTASALDAAFLDLGADVPSGFLNIADTRRMPVEGEALLVQIAKDRTADKGPTLTARIALVGGYLVYRPGEAERAVSARITDKQAVSRLQSWLSGRAGWTARTAAAGASLTDLDEEEARLVKEWDAIGIAARNAKPLSMLRREPGLVMRLMRDHPGVRRIVFDAPAALAAARRGAAERWPDMAGRLVPNDEGGALFEIRGIEDEIDRALEPRVALPHGASLVIEPMTAFVAIDVNTGAGRGRASDAIWEANLAAAREIGRQIRLRNLSGRIVVDFIAMERRDRRESVLAALRAAVAADPQEVRVAGYTALGLVELARRRGRESLAAQLCDPVAAPQKSALTIALAALRRASSEAASAPGRALELRVSSDVAAALEGEAKSARLELEARLGRALLLCAEAGRARGDMDIGEARMPVRLARATERG
ncbi:MAG: ribonuclease E/G [Alphaproteobacteria bacterium]